ncbi:MULTISPECIES: cystathionine gamma-lyase [unclassified Saccharopolyspora]|uniref:cystathionine gamma-lyase n=1 Tax=unclassified Saccharopolyspora TaxID=2646250 RepID=UPI001CD65892|nr:MULTISPECIES: cystathionine gamma-lyase [unclassified Saccharopolyspora]MCA1187796.1 cystathionine gamma-lyase [Saccharopolyspora sp. 6T]MCA1190960.1 cystathionine gamma-lyase [Saccharopolyspora sp. 6V]MCA1227660.1 cystathionine gamma-lyase [Saccharopolyspora sp. 6M]MCA1279862.1 cystathionine gamma-lyase [Saccharopolyspora sp. 7B]
MDDGTRYGDGTRCVHGGHGDPEPGTPLAPGPVFAAPYHLGDPAADFYGRAGNPTWRALESAIGELDGGECVLLPSGMAAISTVLRAVLRAGDGLLVPSDGYYATRQFVHEELAELSLRVQEIPTTGPWPPELFDGVRLVLLETPSNPGLDVCDVAALARLAHRAGALLAVDNTTATPLGQRPLELGADLAIASDTKALTGHSDVLLGHVSTADAELAARLRRARTLSGSIPGPFETWLAHRSLGTLDLRLARQASNAAALVAALRGHPAVTGLRWPGLPDDPAHELASAQMRRWGGVFRFELADADAVAEFVRRSELVVAATSFGGLHSTVDRRAQWGDPVAPGFVRFSAGCEDPDDLVADVLAALS